MPDAADVVDPPNKGVATGIPGATGEANEGVDFAALKLKAGATGEENDVRLPPKTNGA